jgi:hypothetical protein
MKLVIALLIGAGTAWPVQAEDARFPDFDIKANCTKVVHDGLMTEADCASGEFGARSMAGALWPNASTAVRKECTQSANYLTEIVREKTSLANRFRIAEAARRVQDDVRAIGFEPSPAGYGELIVRRADRCRVAVGIIEAAHGARGHMRPLQACRARPLRRPCQEQCRRHGPSACTRLMLLLAKYA